MEQTGNHAEFLRLYNAYYKAVYYTSLGLLHQPDAAADCMPGHLCRSLGIPPQG